MSCFDPSAEPGHDAVRIAIAAPASERARLRALLAGEGHAVVSEADALADLDLEPGADLPIDVVVVAGGGAGVAGPPPPLPAVFIGAAPSETETPAAFLEASPLDDELIAAIRAVAAGLTVYGPGMRPAPVQGGPEIPPPEDLAGEPLTAREMEVLSLLALGLPNKGIALELGISEHTAKYHVGAILSKLDAQSRADAVMRAARAGLLPL
jgi:DNA-binding CsgD family transcriptional regulator